MTLRKAFTNHKPSDSGVEKILQIRRAASEMADLIENVCPQSRERSVALTELETMTMWAIKSIVLNDSESVPDTRCAIFPKGQDTPCYSCQGKSNGQTHICLTCDSKGIIPGRKERCCLEDGHSGSHRWAGGD